MLSYRLCLAAAKTGFETVVGKEKDSDSQKKGKGRTLVPTRSAGSSATHLATLSRDGTGVGATLLLGRPPSPRDVLATSRRDGDNRGLALSPPYGRARWRPASSWISFAWRRPWARLVWISDSRGGALRPRGTAQATENGPPECVLLCVCWVTVNSVLPNLLHT
ncbi:hypothetical protein BRADI_3g27128v3 [Brachypodium distachyon]|uniref:Uncharacterized protein n=1 Tax=Brachypodium distachyon TaxID=15368 RepID=A0A0Q3LWS9_BRADI|nr:hypothetical protein BRADI_3g27128v3 [Brachypodium distachyon]